MNRNEIKVLAIAISAIAACLSVSVLQGIISTAEAIEITVLAVLVLVTAIYVKRTREIANFTKEQAAATRHQADASVKMVEEMKAQRLAMYKPHIVLESRSGTRGKYFMKKIGVGVGNEQGGSAINVELHITHPFFKFSRFRYPFSISVGQNPIQHDFCVEEPSVEDDPGVEVDPIALVVANYEDVSGNPWYSTLELHWNATSRGITPGRMQVAVPGHLDKAKVQ